MMYGQPRFLPGGDRALFLEFGNAISPELNREVRRALLAIENARIPGVIEAVPTYRSLLIYFDPLKISSKELKDKIETLTQQAPNSRLPQPTVTEIPTVYGNDYGPDLDFVANYHYLSPDEVIRIHTSAIYLVCMIGFTPGFAYLGGMSPGIATPRRGTPRISVPSGSVGIGANETGVYAVESPGGWQLIGRTPLRLFDPSRQPPALLQSGNYVTFTSISPQEFIRIREEVEQGTYQVKQTLLTENDDN